MAVESEGLSYHTRRALARVKGAASGSPRGSVAAWIGVRFYLGQRRNVFTSPSGPTSTIKSLYVEFGRGGVRPWRAAWRA